MQLDILSRWHPAQLFKAGLHYIPLSFSHSFIYSANSSQAFLPDWVLRIQRKHTQLPLVAFRAKWNDRSLHKMALLILCIPFPSRWKALIFPLSQNTQNHDLFRHWCSWLLIWTNFIWDTWNWWFSQRLSHVSLGEGVCCNMHGMLWRHGYLLLLLIPPQPWRNIQD